MKKKFTKILGIGLSIALMTSLLVAAVPAIALSTPVVSFATFGDDVISVPDADYVINFDVNKMLKEDMSIIITFPAGTVVSSPTASIAATDGWDTTIPTSPIYRAANLTSSNWTYSGLARTVTYTLGAGDFVGENAEVRVAFTAGIKNPGTPGNYTLTVETAKNLDMDTLEAEKTSEEYAIKVPYVAPLSGIVSAYNDKGILMGQSHFINAMIAAAGEDGTVEIGPGTYAEEWVVANVSGQTIKGTGAPGTVILQSFHLNSVIEVEADNITLDNLTLVTTMFVQSSELIDVEDGDVTITNCELTVGEDTDCAIAIDGPSAKTVISNTTVDLTAKGAQYGIDNYYGSTGGEIEVTDCMFYVGKDDTAIYTAYKSKISGITIDGSSGTGIVTDCGTVTIDASNFMSLNQALHLDAGTVTVKNSVIDGCGSVTTDAIAIYDADVNMYNNTIQNSYEKMYAINIDDADVEIHFNNILNNAYNIKAAGTANCSHNWYGSADGPAALSTSGLGLDIMPYLGNSVTSAEVALDKSSATGKTKVGMDATIITGTADVIGLAKYSANPELTPPTIMGTGNVIGYYDLYVAGAPANQIVQIKIYVPVTPYTKLYYAGGISGQWSQVENAGVNLASGFVYADIGGTTTGLAVSDLGGTVFAVVEDKTTTAGPSIASGVGSPTIGSYDVSTEPMFTWGAVPGSIRYEIALSEDPTFTIIEWSYNVDQSFYKVDEPLRYDTTYYWRVRGVLGEPYQEGGQWLTPATPWTTGIFTTASEPAPPPDPIVVQPTKPEVNVEIPPTKITIEPAEQAIPNYMLWIIVAVGAILVIALIVLIVRTRRVV